MIESAILRIVGEGVPVEKIGKVEAGDVNGIGEDTLRRDGDDADKSLGIVAVLVHCQCVSS